MDTNIFNNFFGGTIFLAILTYVGFQLKTLPNILGQQIRKQFIYTTYIEETSELFDYFEKWLKEYYKDCFKTVNVSLDHETKYDENKINEYEENKQSKIKKLKFTHYSDTFIIKYKHRRLIITKGREKLENASNIRNAYFNNFKIEGWRVKAVIFELLNEVIEYNKSIEKTVEYIYTSDSYGNWNYFGETVGKDINKIFIKGKEELLKDIQDFISLEQWYNERSLNYKRGYLFHGMPGNGKTSTCLALSKLLNRNIYFLNLNDFTEDAYLYRVFKQLPSKPILVIEDIDCIVNNRNDNENKSKVSFSALLNCLDGALSPYGMITIMTTNCIEKLDKALIREGRIDYKLEINNPPIDLIENYLNIFYSREDIQINVNYNKNYSMSKIQELCLQNKDDYNKVIKELS